MLMSQFADDTTLYLSFDRITLNAVIDNLDIISQNTGLMVNYDKTNIYRIGSLANSDAQLYTTRLFHWTNIPIKMLGIIIPTVPDLNQLMRLNYSGILEKATKILDLWSLRGITLSGRVLLVNTLVASLFVYKIQVIPNLDSNFIASLNELISQFLWKKKHPKISSRILIKDKYQGGLRLVDMSKRQKSLKAQWMLNINTSIFWSTVFYSKMVNNIGEEIWNCNLHARHVNVVCRQEVDPFWIEVLSAWAEFNYDFDDDMETPLANQYLWYNSNILLDNKPFLLLRAQRAGMMLLSDIFKPNGQIKTHRELTNEFGHCLNWFEYAQLITAIPRAWVIKVETHGLEQSLSHFQRLSNETKISQTVYSALIDDGFKLTNRLNRWQRKLNCVLNEKDFLKQFRNLYGHTIATKFRDFQFKLLMGVLVTNRKLVLYQIADSELCSFCGQFVEEEIHLFCKCTKIRHLWEALKQYIQDNMTSDVDGMLVWSDRNIIFSSVHPQATNAINFLVTIVKRLIYVARCTGHIPRTEHLFREIEEVFQFESNIAHRKQKLKRHVEKWSTLKQIEYEDNEFINQYIELL